MMEEYYITNAPELDYPPVFQEMEYQKIVRQSNTVKSGSMYNRETDLQDVHIHCKGLTNLQYKITIHFCNTVKRRAFKIVAEEKYTEIEKLKHYQDIINYNAKYPLVVTTTATINGELKNIEVTLNPIQLNGFPETKDMSMRIIGDVAVTTE